MSTNENTVPQAVSKMNWPVDLPQGALAVDAAIVIKVMLPDGAMVNCMRYTKDFNSFEALGMLDIAYSQMKDSLIANFVEANEDGSDAE